MDYAAGSAVNSFSMSSLARSAEVGRQALELLRASPEKARRFLTTSGIEWGNRVVERAWRLGEELWTRYAEES